MLESYIERETSKWAKANGVPSLKIDPTYFAGAPDRIFMVPGGRPLIVEFKRVGEDPEPIQVYWAGEFKRLGYDVRWTDSKEEAIGWLKERLNEYDNRNDQTKRTRTSVRGRKLLPK